MHRCCRQQGKPQQATNAKSNRRWEGPPSSTDLLPSRNVTDRVSFTAALAAVVLALTGCGPTATTPAGGTATTAAKLSGLQEYQTIQAMADDLAKHGHPCTELTQLGGGFFNVDGAKCTIDGEVMILELYTSQSQIDAQLKVLDSFRENHLDFGWLAGKNWTINCGTRPVCEKVQDDMGGSIVAALPVSQTSVTAPR